MCELWKSGKIFSKKSVLMKDLDVPKIKMDDKDDQKLQALL